MTRIAIQGHPTRGKEVIQILESLGGRNTFNHNGDHIRTAYFIGMDYSIYGFCTDSPKLGFKVYTLEEFEKEFPFKIGDKVIDYEGDVAIITGFVHIEEKLGYSLQYKNGRGTATSGILKPYKEMKEERNITLTLEKAKEWYNKGGELREIALQAFTEKELNPLPKSWEEFCKQGNLIASRRYGMPMKYEALFKLEKLRDCYNNSSNDTNRIAIINNNGNIEFYVNPPFNCFLTFKNYLLAKEFFSNFKEIIEIAKELI